MITHVAEHNDKLYDALFADITSAISGVTVRTIEEYFLNLETIAQYVSKGTMIGIEGRFYSMRHNL